MNIKNDMIVRNIKRNTLYKIVCIGLHSETLEEMVIYKSIENNQIWIRPKIMFCDRRFEIVESNEQ